jgi:hypothetical protein
MAHIYLPAEHTGHIYLLPYTQITAVPYKGVGRCLRPEGMGSAQGKGAKEGRGPPDKERDKQSTPSKEGGNLEQEEEGKKSQA